MGAEKSPLRSLTGKDASRAENSKTSTGTSHSLDQGRSLPQVAGHAWCSSVLSAQEQAPTRCRRRSRYTRQTPKSPHVLVRRFGRRTPTRLSRLVGGFHSGVDVVNCCLQHGILVGYLRMRDGRGCQAFDADPSLDV
jgi:hypothetical protein